MKNFADPENFPKGRYRGSFGRPLRLSTPMTSWPPRCAAVLPLAIAHAIGTLLLQGIVTQQTWLHSVAIGARYLRRGVSFSNNVPNSLFSGVEKL